MWFINISGLALIALIVWWFWLYRPDQSLQRAKSGLKITISEGVYTPARFSIPKEIAFELQFERFDETPCAETVVFPALDISKNVPVGKTITIELPPLKPGAYDFHCQMQMYKGQVVVG